LQDGFSGLCRDVSRNASESRPAKAINAEVNCFFATSPCAGLTAPRISLAELHDALPKRYAQQAEAIYRRHATSSK
jgi:hypothetical protein